MWAPPEEPPKLLRGRILREAERTRQFIPDGVPEKARSRTSGRTGKRVVAAAAMAAVLIAVDVSGSVVLSDETGSAAVLMAGLDDPGHRVYTLWLTPPEGPSRNLADFAPDDSGSAVINLSEAVGDQDTLAVTLEPRRGAASPTGPVVGSAHRGPEAGSRIS